MRDGRPVDRRGDVCGRKDLLDGSDPGIFLCMDVLTFNFAA
jgi:hypothetical protein